MPWPLHENPASVVSVFTSFMPGYRLVDGEDLLTQANLLFSTKDLVSAGNTQQNATMMDTYISQVTEGGTIELPPGLPGRYLVVMNDTASPLQVYGHHLNVLTGEADTVASAGTSSQQVSVSQAAGQACEYFCFAPGMWKQFSGSDGTVPSTGGLPEAPINGTTYGRLNGTWVPVLNLGGGSMTGPLILSGSAPTDPNQAVSLSFVQNMAIDEGTY